MKRLTLSIILFLFFTTSNNAIVYRAFTSLTGEVVGSVDNVDCGDIGDGTEDAAGIVHVSTGEIYFYYFDQSATNATSSPDYIRCKNYATSGVWIKLDLPDDDIDSEHYTDGSIDEAHLNIANSPTDEYALTYESDTSNFQWTAIPGGGDITTVGLCTTGDCTADFIDGTDIGDDVVDSEHYAAGSVDAEHLAADIVDETKIADDGIDSEHYTAGSIDEEHLNIANAPTDEYYLTYEADTSNFQWVELGAGGDITEVGTCTTAACTDDFIDGTDVADEAVDSEHYTDGSIDPEHLNIANAETDEYVLTYETDTTNFQWVAMPTGDITTVGLCTTGDCTADFIDDTDIADDSVKEEHLDAANAPTDEYVLTYEADTSNFQWVSLAGGGDITTVGLCTTGDCTADFIDGTDIGDDVIDSEHYVAGSVDAEHLAADIIDETKIADDGINSEHYNDGSIDPEHLNIQSAETNLYLLSYASGTSNFDWIAATAYGHGILALADEAALQALITSPWSVADGGTNSGTALNNDRVVVSSGGAIVESAVISTSELELLNGETDLANQAELNAVAALVDTDDEIIAIINASPSTQIGVPAGGTGVGDLTDGGVLLGSGTGAVSPMAVLTDGQMIVGDGTTDPVAESGATLRTSIGVGSSDAVTFATVTATVFSSPASATPGSTYLDSGSPGETLIKNNSAGDSVYKIQVDDSSGDNQTYIEANGTDENVVIHKPLNHGTQFFQLTGADLDLSASGWCKANFYLSDAAAASDEELTLPASGLCGGVAGNSIEYKFINQDTDGGYDLDINPNGTDVIFLDGVSCGAGKAVELEEEGDSATIIGISSVNWLVINHNGAECEP